MYAAIRIMHAEPVFVWKDDILIFLHPNLSIGATELLSLSMLHCQGKLKDLSPSWQSTLLQTSKIIKRTSVYHFYEHCFFLHMIKTSFHFGCNACLALFPLTLFSKHGPRYSSTQISSNYLKIYTKFTTVNGFFLVNTPHVILNINFALASDSCRKNLPIILWPSQSQCYLFVFKLSYKYLKCMNTCNVNVHIHAFVMFKFNK